MGMYVAFVYYGLRDYDVASTERGGDLVLPIVGLPARVHVVDRPTTATALVIALVVAALLGVRSEEHTSELQSLAYPRMPSSA